MFFENQHCILNIKDVFTKFTGHPMNWTNMISSKGQVYAKNTFDSISKTEGPVYFEQVGKEFHNFVFTDGWRLYPWQKWCAETMLLQPNWEWQTFIWQAFRHSKKLETGFLMKYQISPVDIPKVVLSFFSYIWWLVLCLLRGNVDSMWYYVIRKKQQLNQKCLNSLIFLS